MASEKPAPAHVAEMKVWVALGGSNSGIQGNGLHVYGFHRGAIRVPVSDYSRKRDPKGTSLSAYDGNGVYCCAGDYHHGGKAALRARHAVLLTRLMDGDPELSHVCEMITQPWANRPVYYWAVWNGRRTLQRYTGKGHDMWSHVSVWRSQCITPPPLWTPASAATGTSTVTSRKPTTLKAPAWPAGKVIVASSSAKYDALARAWQARMKQRGWSIKVDGYYGPSSAKIARSFQADKHLGVDGKLGPKTFAAAWTSAVTK